MPRHSASSSGPAARWIAPSTPPPPSNDSLAALTMASTSRVTMLARRAWSLSIMRFSPTPIPAFPLRGKESCPSRDHKTVPSPSGGGLGWGWVYSLRVVSRRHPRVDDAYLARLHDLDCAAHRVVHRVERLDRAERHSALRARHRRDVDVGFRDPLPDPRVLGRPAARFGDVLLVALVVEVRAIVADDHEQRDAVMRSGPHRGV